MAYRYEMNAIAPLLEEEWEDAEDLVNAVVAALDKARMDRTRYVAVMQFGTEDGKCFYLGLGPFPGVKSARKAAERHPGASAAHKIVVVPVTSPEGMDRMLKEVG